ncbi:hypothetical protein FEM48_Zijuj07G0099100 [Ziziphus jujuba var. spinosa]|uniref:Uncharacterized protein n=1 Tax=Ziziphus jujuba var. spinosa TaxID=714518 RepID=A0A978V3Z1_ZIZJJ|nr:hypothetical protein FEM48_Zijuj07G0099100 [Ziziphus jujuba var. spinosa]
MRGKMAFSRLLFLKPPLRLPHIHRRGLSKSTRSEAASDQEAKSVEADRKKWTLQLHFLFQLLVVVIFHVCFIYLLF